MGISKYDIESDADTIKKFGYKTTKKKYKGKNPAGIPVYKRSITRIADKNTGEEAVVKRSTKHGGAEGQQSRTRESYDGPGHMMPKHWKDKLKINKKKKTSKRKQTSSPVKSQPKIEAIGYNYETYVGNNGQ